MKNEGTPAAKKRGRKPKEKVYSIKTSPDVSLCMSPTDTVILQLPVSSSECEEKAFDTHKMFEYSPEVPEIHPFAPEQPFSSEVAAACIDRLELGEGGKSRHRVVEFEDKKSDRRVYNVLFDQDDSLFPSSTGIWCWWCSHPFDSIPVGLPIAHEHGSKSGDVSEAEEGFVMYGIFCSHNCACSYLFASPEYRDRLWTIYSSLNMLYRASHPNEARKVLPAPPRQALQVFGGHMTIADFRKGSQTNDRSHSLKLPPMTIVHPQIEETRHAEGRNIPVNLQKMHAGSQRDLALKRSKPYMDPKKTIGSWLARPS
ncbi:g752 [Coccomyxa elongata]